MPKYSKFMAESMRSSVGHSSCRLLSEEQGCEGDCAAGISLYHETTFPEPMKHPFQEGFYVISGNGEAKVGADCFPISQDMAFIVPRNTEHTIRAEHGCSVRVFWFHCT